MATCDATKAKAVETAAFAMEETSVMLRAQRVVTCYRLLQSWVLLSWQLCFIVMKIHVIRPNLKFVIIISLATPAAGQRVLYFSS